MHLDLIRLAGKKQKFDTQAVHVFRYHKLPVQDCLNLDGKSR